MKIEVRPYAADDLDACRAIFATLPEWFGLPESNAAYLRGLAELESYVALSEGRVVGFASLRFHDAASAELELIAVDRSVHRQGVGSQLVEHLEQRLEERGNVRLFHVKTRGPSEPDPGYERTRQFYLARDFVPLFETSALWGAENPALIMVKVLRTSRSSLP